MRKGSLPFGGAVELIIALAIIIIILGVTAVIISSTSGAAPKITCKVSVATQLLTNPTGLNSPFDIVCPRKLIIIDDERGKISHLAIADPRINDDGVRGFNQDYEYAFINSNGGHSTKKIITREDVPQVFAYEVSECWDTFVRGQAQFLNQESHLSNINTCVICSEIIFRSADLPDQVNFQDYYQNTPHHFGSSTEANTYSDFLYNADDPSRSITCAEDLFINKMPLERDRTYAVYFASRRSKLGTIFNRQAWLYQSLPIIGSYIGDRRFGCQGAFVAPIEDLPNYCDLVAN